MLEKATKRMTRSALGLACMLATLGTVHAQNLPVSPTIAVSPVRITYRGSQCRNPAIAVSSAGRVTVVAESGPQNAGRLVVVEFSYQGSVYPEPLALSGPGDCRHPSLVYDISGTLHLVWRERTSDAYAIRYAWRTPDNVWHDGGRLSHTPDLDCEFPQVAVDNPEGRVWATWQAGVGTRYGIYLAWRDAPSSFTTVDVTGDAGDHYHLRPQIFPESPYPLVWYEEVQNTFLLRALVTDEGQVMSPLDFDRLDIRKTPELFQAPSGMLGGVWIDLVGRRNRVLMGLQDPAMRGEGLVVDTTPSGEAIEPTAVAVGASTVALAWINREPVGSAIYIGRVDGTSKVAESLALQVLQYDDNDDAISRPRLAAGEGRLVHCVWYSDASRGGSGNLYYAVLRF